MARRLALLAFLAAVLAATTTAVLPAGEVARAAASAVTASTDPVVGVAGDIACDPTDSQFNGGAGTTRRCKEQATANLLASAHLSAVIALGDEQYNTASDSAFAASYNPTWGQLKSLTFPVPGNHEYLSRGAAGYYRYFGTSFGSSGNPANGYYSFSLGSWHLVALNGNCSQAGGCGTGAPQESWLRADLADHPATCTLAFWHQPRFSSAKQGDNPAYAALWSDLYGAKADVVLNAHHHHYERFAPMNPTGAADSAQGVREFIVGTGGESLVGFGQLQATTQATAQTYGILTLTLHPTSYDWAFVATTGSVLDTGSAPCH